MQAREMVLKGKFNNAAWQEKTISTCGLETICTEDCKQNILICSDSKFVNCHMNVNTFWWMYDNIPIYQSLYLGATALGAIASEQKF